MNVVCGLASLNGACEKLGDYQVASVFVRPTGARRILNLSSDGKIYGVELLKEAVKWKYL
jgi:hypothetical protein